jgi:hypothetical protein
MQKPYRDRQNYQEHSGVILPARASQKSVEVKAQKKPRAVYRG